MTTSIPIEGALVIAAMTPPVSKAPFNRGVLVLRASDGTLVRAQTYTSEARAEGPSLSIEDVQGLIDAGHATELPTSAAIPAASGATLWVLRRSLPHRDRALADLRMSGLLIRPPLVGPDDAKLCVVNEGQPEGATIRDRWRDEAMAAAGVHAERREWNLAMTNAEIAQAVCRGLDPDVLALLGLAYEHCGRTKRASGLLVIARRSRGEDFVAQMIRASEHFRNTLIVGPPAKAELNPELLAALRGRFPKAAQSFGKPRSCRLAV